MEAMTTFFDTDRLLHSKYSMAVITQYWHRSIQITFHIVNNMKQIKIMQSVPFCPV